MAKDSNGEIDKEEIKALLAELKSFTPKQALFFINFGIMGNQTKAALKTYYPDFPHDKPYGKLTDEEKITYHTATGLGAKNLQKHDNPMWLYMQMRGMDFKRAIEVLDRGLDSEDEKVRVDWWDRLMRLMDRDVSESAQKRTAGARFETPEGNKIEIVIQDYNDKK
jgi:hypothetical protein